MHGHSHSKNQMYEGQDLGKDIKEQTQNIVIYLNKYDTILHYILNKNISNKLILFYRSKSNVIMISILCLFYWILIGLLPLYIHSKWYHIQLYTIVVTILFFIYLAWSLIGILSCNYYIVINMFWFNFQFYYKLFNAMVWITCDLIIASNNDSYLFINIMSGIATILAVILFGISEGWQTKKVSKIIIGFWLLIVFIQTLYISIKFTQDNTINIFGYSFSLKSIMNSAITNLIIFFGKQLWTLIRYGDNVFINTPYLHKKWIQTNNNLYLINNHS